MPENNQPPTLYLLQLLQTKDLRYQRGICKYVAQSECKNCSHDNKTDFSSSSYLLSVTNSYKNSFPQIRRYSRTGDNGLSSFTAFTATLSGKHVKWLKGDIIKYSRILTNIGNRYDPSTGIFTVETPGVYSVSTSMIGGIRQCTLATLRKNGNILVWLFTGPKWDMASQTIYIAMVKGDKIWVQIQSNILKLNVKHIYHHLNAVLIKPGKF
ncbi:C1QL [Mytilus coruscus]|uniref:C1QL n=1 Tax=Mytilus coruscus TaxID=42192 RepID=A0A6J8C0R5_MYTCO|nr:C1QL [Mytilus coruscus]